MRVLSRRGLIALIAVLLSFAAISSPPALLAGGQQEKLLSSTWPGQPMPANDQGPSALTVTVDCSSRPERTTLTHSGRLSILLDNFTLGSLYAPGPNEPFPISGALRFGESKTFETGPGATQNRLSDDEIYDDTAPGEGVRLTGGFGLPIEVLCAERTVTRFLGVPGGAAASATSLATATATPAPTDTAAVPSLPRAGAGSSGARPWSPPWRLGLNLLLITLGGVYVVRRCA